MKYCSGSEPLRPHRARAAATTFSLFSCAFADDRRQRVCRYQPRDAERDGDDAEQQQWHDREPTKDESPHG